MEMFHSVLVLEYSESTPRIGNSIRQLQPSKNSLYVRQLPKFKRRKKNVLIVNFARLCFVMKRVTLKPSQISGNEITICLQLLHNIPKATSWLEKVKKALLPA